MNVFVAIEVSDRQQEVIKKLIAKGYASRWNVLNDNSVYYPLPSNCVWQPNIELQKAYQDVESIITEINSNSISKIVLKSCIVIPAAPWIGKAFPRING